MIKITLISSLLALSSLPAFASAINVVVNQNQYGSVNDSTGVYTRIANLPTSQLGGIATYNGLLYVEDFCNNLYTIDSLTGVAHLTGNAGSELKIAAFTGGSEGLFEVDYSSNLYSINAGTGKATLVGKTGLAANNGYDYTSLSTDGTSLYYTVGRPGSTDELYKISPQTGVTTDLGNTGVTGVGGSAIVNGNLELFQAGMCTDYIYWAALGTATFSRGAQLGAEVIDGGTFASAATQSSGQLGSAPEPGTFALIAGGVIAASAYKRRRSKAAR